VRARSARCSVAVRAVERRRLPRETADDVVVSFLTDAGAVCVTSIHGNSLPATRCRRHAGRDVSARHPACARPSTSTRDRLPRLVTPTVARPRCASGTASWWPAVHAQAAGPAGTALPPLAKRPRDGGRGSAASDRAAIAGSRPHALVMTAVYATTTGVNVRAPGTRSSRKLGRVASGDLDARRRLDAVLAAADEDDLDVTYRLRLGVELFRVDTAARISSLSVGDLDGNGVADIAYTEPGVGHHAMLVAYGTADRPLPPVQVATFSDVSSVPAAFRDSAISWDRGGPRVTQPGRAGGGPTIRSSTAAPKRTMLSFFDPGRPRSTTQRGPRCRRGGRQLLLGPPTIRPICSDREPSQDQAALGMLACASPARRAGSTDPERRLPSEGVALRAGCARRRREPRRLRAGRAVLRLARSGRRDVVFAIDRPLGAAAGAAGGSIRGRRRAARCHVRPGVTPASRRTRCRGRCHAADLDGDGRSS
jgi:hypothetical protein